MGISFSGPNQLQHRSALQIPLTHISQSLLAIESNGIHNYIFFDASEMPNKLTCTVSTRYSIFSQSLAIAHQTHKSASTHNLQYQCTYLISPPAFFSNFFLNLNITNSIFIPVPWQFNSFSTTIFLEQCLCVTCVQCKPIIFFPSSSQTSALSYSHFIPCSSLMVSNRSLAIMQVMLLHLIMIELHLFTEGRFHSP